MLRVWPEDPRILGEVIEVKARLEGPGAEEVPIWFRLPSRYLPAVTESADPFVLAALFLAMRRGSAVRVHGQVSPTLLCNLKEVQAAWARWRPDRYRAVDIAADAEVDARAADAGGALLAFSGGLDSCFSAWRHTSGDRGWGTRALAAGVMVHGFDIPLHQGDVFDRAASSSRRILESVGLQLIPVASNFRELGDDWRDAHGAALASCLHMLSGGYATGLVASSHAFDALRFPWGSNPVTDPMLSSAAFSIVYDAGGYSRRDKARDIAGWSAAMRDLRVCWDGPQKDRNCGACVRCIGTALCFAVEGMRQPDSLPVQSLERAVEGLAHQPMKPAALSRLQDILVSARSSGVEDPWVGALDRLVRSHRRWDRFEQVMPWPRLAGHLRWLAGPRRGPRAPRP